VVVVGPSLGFETGAVLTDRQAESSNHVVEHMIGLVAKPSVANLKWNVSIPKVITSAGQQNEVVCSGSRQCFGCGLNLYEVAFRRSQPIALAKATTVR
jgi:hypothetical protein